MICPRCALFPSSFVSKDVSAVVKGLRRLGRGRAGQRRGGGAVARYHVRKFKDRFDIQFDDKRFLHSRRERCDVGGATEDIVGEASKAIRV